MEEDTCLEYLKSKIKSSLTLCISSESINLYVLYKFTT